jgi:hypothetical protein
MVEKMANRNKYIVTRRVTYIGGLDWMIGFIAPYTFTILGATGSTALSLSYTH